MWKLIAPQGPFVRKEWVAKSSKGVDIFFSLSYRP
jgi:hypothetical protein